MNSEKSNHWLRSIGTSLWFVWLIVTFGDAVTMIGGGERAHWSYYPYALFNLFTPMYLGNFSVTSKRIVTIPILLGGLFLGDFMGRWIKRVSFRLAYNLFILFLLTVTIDLISQGTAMSVNELAARVWYVQERGTAKDFQKIIASEPALFHFEGLELGKSTFSDSEIQFGSATLRTGFVRDSRSGICYQGPDGTRLYFSYLPVMANEPAVISEALVSDHDADLYESTHCEPSSKLSNTITIAHLGLDMSEDDVQARWGKPRKKLPDGAWFYDYSDMQVYGHEATLTLKFRNGKLASFYVTRGSL
jgi:hypothetical protein